MTADHRNVMDTTSNRLRSRKRTYIRTRIQRVQTTNAVHDTSERSGL